MEEIIEYFGTGLLAIAALAGTIAIVSKIMGPGGVLLTVVLHYLCSICG